MSPSGGLRVAGLPTRASCAFASPRLASPRLALCDMSKRLKELRAVARLSLVPRSQRLPFGAICDAMFNLVDAEIGQAHAKQLRAAARLGPASSVDKRRASHHARPQPPPPAPAPYHVPLQEYAHTLRAVLVKLLDAPLQMRHHAPIHHAPMHHAPMHHAPMRLRHRWPPSSLYLGERARKMLLLRSVLSLHRLSAGRAFRQLCRLSASLEEDEDDEVVMEEEEEPLFELSYAELLEAWKADRRYADVTFPYHVLSRPIGQARRALGDAKRIGERMDVEEMLCFMRGLDEEDEGSVNIDSFQEAMAVGGGRGARRRGSKRRRRRLP